MDVSPYPHNMPPEINNPITTTPHPVNKITSVSKYLALALFIVLPFVGAYVGYRMTGESVVEVPVAQTQTSLITKAVNYNKGTIPTRFIIVNSPEAAFQLTKTDVSNAKVELEKLKDFVLVSSYGRAILTGKVEGTYKLSTGICNAGDFGKQSKTLTQKALETADKVKPFKDFDYFIIYHATTNCSTEPWSAEGNSFKPYTLNGRVVQLRGIRTPSIDSSLLKHEFGHSLGYINSIGHNEFLVCPLKISSATTTLNIDSQCKKIFDSQNGILPIYDIMSGNFSVLQDDYGVLTKLLATWLPSKYIIETNTARKYTLQLFTNTKGTKALKIPIDASTNVYLSLRKPLKHSSITEVGVVAEVTSENIFLQQGFLALDTGNFNKPLTPGRTYKIGQKTIKVTSLTQSSATILVQ